MPEFTDHMFGTVILDIECHDNGNGTYKASCMGLEVNHRDQAEAVRQLQQKLEAGILDGTVAPESV